MSSPPSDSHELAKNRIVAGLAATLRNIDSIVAESALHISSQDELIFLRRRLEHERYLFLTEFSTPLVRAKVQEIEVVRACNAVLNLLNAAADQIQSNIDHYIVSLGQSISEDETERRSLAERLILLRTHLTEIENPAALALFEKLFPEIPRRPPLPERAPALWRKPKETDPDFDPSDDRECKHPGDTPPDFIRRHYGPWLGNGLTRADIRRLDPPLYMALANWLRHNELPTDLDLPTLKEENDRWVERARSEGQTGRGLDRLAKAMRARGA